MLSMQEGEEVDIHTIDCTLRIIQQRAKVAEARYLALLEALYEFMHDFDAPAIWEDETPKPDNSSQAAESPADAGQNRT